MAQPDLHPNTDQTRARYQKILSEAERHNPPAEIPFRLAQIHRVG